MLQLNSIQYGMFLLWMSARAPAQCQLQYYRDHLGQYADHLGFKVALADSVVVASAPLKDYPLSPNAGALFALERVGNRWQDTILWLPDPITGDGLGWALAAEGDSIFAGCFRRRTVFEWCRGPAGWQLVDAIVPDGPWVSDGFPWSIAVHAGRMICGAQLANRAFIFEKDGEGRWRQVAHLAPSVGGGEFGWSVAIHADLAVVGAPNDLTQGNYAGAAFVFERQVNGQWVQADRLLPQIGGLQASGISVAIRGLTVLSGAPGAFGGHGVVYVYDRESGGSWVASPTLRPLSPLLTYSFGEAVAMEGEWVVVGAPSAAIGELFVVCRNQGSWSQVARLASPDMGYSAALGQNQAVVGAPFRDEYDANGDLVEDVGAAYVFAVGPDSDDNGVMDVCECRAVGDLTLDGAIDFQDLILVLSSFALDAAGDLDADGDTDLQDLANLLANFGRACP